MDKSEFGQTKVEAQQRVQATQARIEQLRTGERLVKSGAVNLQDLATGATQQIAQNKADRRSLGINAQKENEGKRATLLEKGRQDSTNRRLLREIKKTEKSGRVSSWLKNYVSQKEAEVNSASATSSMIKRQASSMASISITRSSQTPIGQSSVAVTSPKLSTGFPDSGGMIGTPP